MTPEAASETRVRPADAPADPTFDLVPAWTEETLREAGRVVARATRRALDHLSALADAGRRGDWLAAGLVLDQARAELARAAYVLGRQRADAVSMPEAADLLPAYAERLEASYCFRPDRRETAERAVGELAQVLRWLVYYHETLFDLPPPGGRDAVAAALRRALAWDVRLDPEPPVHAGVYGAALASVYDEARPLAPAAIAGLQELAERWLRGRDVLELGAGTGRIGTVVLPYVRSYRGLELSPPMLERFRAKLAPSPAPHATLELGDALAIPAPPESVDAVFEHEVLLFVPSPERAVDEAFRVIRPGGWFLRVVIHPVGRDVSEELYAAFRRGACAVTGRPFVIRGKGTDGRVTRQLERAGIATEDVTLARWAEAVTVGDLVDRIEARAHPYLAGLPDDALAAGVAELRAFAVRLGLRSARDELVVPRRLYALASRKPARSQSDGAPR